MEHEYLFPLLLKVAKSDTKAFESLYNATKGQMYAVVLKMLKSQELAEEATQEAFVKIWYNASSYREGQGTVLTWMISIARYRALDMIRYKKVRKEETLDSDYVDNSQSMFQQDSINQKQLDHCMLELDTSQRQAIHLAFFDGLSHAEVVQCLDTPLGTIKSWIRRGLQSLKRCLAL